MTSDRTPSPDPFEAAVGRYLKASSEPVPLRLRIAVEQAGGTLVPAAQTRWTGRLFPLAASTLAVAVIVAVGALAILGGPDDRRSGDVVAPGAASPLPDTTSDPEPVVLDDGNIVDPEVAAVIDELLGEIDPSPSPRTAASALVATVAPELLVTLPEDVEPENLVKGPRGGAYWIDTRTATVYRADLKNGRIADIVHEGDKQQGTDRTIGRPVELAAAGPDVVVVDDKARPWRWRPSNSAGAGTLAKLTLQGRAGFESDHGDVEAYESLAGPYRMYVAEPSLNQIERYRQTFDGSAFFPPSPYLASQTVEVAGFRALYVDLDVYALFEDGLRRHQYGRYDGTFTLDLPSDEADLRPGHDYRLVDGSGRASSGGRVYLYDALHGRVIGFSKDGGSYLGQWQPKGDGTEMDDMRGMYVIEGGLTKKGKRKNDTLVWVTPAGIYQAVLTMLAPEEPE